MKTNELIQLLPSVFQRTMRTESPLAAVLSVMEELHAPPENILDSVESIFDPNRTPDQFVPFLARWVDLEQTFTPASNRLAADESVPISTGLGRLRELTNAAAHLSKWRGTTFGLQRFLEIATGSTGFVILENSPDDAGKPRPFHVHVIAPGALSEHRALLERIVEVERPAYATWELSFASTPLTTSVAPGQS